MNCDRVAELKGKIEYANKVITDICDDIRELKEDYHNWEAYKNKLEQKLHGWDSPPEPTREKRERKGD